MTAALLVLLAQGACGAFDTLYYHEWRVALPGQRGARRELLLHAARDGVYFLIFAGLAWADFFGMFAWLVLALVLAELPITIADFWEEDRTRVLPRGERLMHTVMAITYGIFLALLLPEVIARAAQDSSLQLVDRGWLSYVFSALALGVLGSGLRDLLAAFGIGPWTGTAGGGSATQNTSSRT